MANATVAAWTTAIKELQQSAGDGRATNQSAQLLSQRMRQLGVYNNETLPKAAWKRLVHDVQVRQHIAQRLARSSNHIQVPWKTNHGFFVHVTRHN